MNLGDLVASIRLNVDDDSGDFVSDSIARDVLGRAFRHIYRKLVNAGIVVDLATLTATFTANTREVLIGGSSFGGDIPSTPNRIQKVVAVQYLPTDTNGTGTDIPIFTRENALKSAIPAVYVRKVKEVPLGDFKIQHSIYLGFHVIPSTGFSVVVEYIPLTEVDLKNQIDTFVVFDLEEEYHDLVVLYATVLVLAKDEEKVGTWVGLYQEALADVLEFKEGSKEVVDVYDGGWE